MIGTVTGAAIIGAVGGPALGVLGDWFGVRTVFALFVAVPVALGLLVARRPTPPVVMRNGSLTAIRAATRDAHVRTGVWLMVVPSAGFGVIALLVPLRLAGRGWQAGAIGAVFLTAAVVEAFASPVAGRAADQHGALAPAWVALALAGIGLALLAPRWPVVVIAALVPVTGAVMGSLWTPAMTLLSSSAEARGLDPAFGFGVANLSWGVGTGLGNVLGGGAAQVAGDWSPFAVIAMVALVTAEVLRRRAVRVRGLSRTA